jgi:hypothetical protein
MSDNQYYTIAELEDKSGRLISEAFKKIQARELHLNRMKFSSHNVERSKVNLCDCQDCLLHSRIDVVHEVVVTLAEMGASDEMLRDAFPFYYRQTE